MELGLRRWLKERESKALFITDLAISSPKDERICAKKEFGLLRGGGREEEKKG